MFHHLPGEEIEKIKNDLSETCRAFESFALAFAGWRFLGRGVAANVEAAELLNLRASLANFWRERLTAQDKQKFQPHITVQNKVTPDRAKALYEKLAADWESFDGRAEGVQLWHYLENGRWKLEEDFLFSV